LLLLRARARERARRERSGPAGGGAAAPVRLHALLQLSRGAAEAGFAGRSASRVPAGVKAVFDGAGAGGCRPTAAAEEKVVVRGCWQLLGWVWCWCRGCSPFRLGLDVVVLVR